MSSVKKPALHSYWSTTALSRTPFLDNTSAEADSKIYFGTYMYATPHQTLLLDYPSMTHLPK